MQLKCLLVSIASLTIYSSASTIAQVEADIATISSDVANLVTAIDAFSATAGVGTLVQALAIHTSATTVNNAITTTTTDVKNAPVPVSNSDAATILADLQGLQPNIAKALNDIVARKAAFTALPIGGIPALVKADLATLNVSTTVLASEFILVAP
ncbi:hypothetical protein H0H93_003134, partial [Arthromyces matolae]